MASNGREKADVISSSVMGPPMWHFLAQKFTDKSWRRGWEFKKRDSWQTLRLWEECIGGVGSPRRIRYGFINEQQAAVAVAIAYLVVSIWKEWEQEREIDRESKTKGDWGKEQSTGGRRREKVMWSKFTHWKVAWQGLVCHCDLSNSSWKSRGYGILATMYFSAPF